MGLEVIQVSGDDAVETLMVKREAYPATGLYPFIIGDQEQLSLVQENMEANNSDQAKDLNVATSFDIQEWLTRRKDELGFEEFNASEIEGDWPGEMAGAMELTAHTNIMNGRPLKQVYIGLVEVDEPWQVPVAVQSGGWNDCPYPGVQGGIMRYWQQAYGAEIVSITGDVIECKVARPPIEKEAALALAWEQYWYCYDIVDQGCETVSNLAASLINSPYWYFWWD